MNPATGTFTSMDTYGGTVFDPVSLHKYLYANANPVTYVDPSGNMSLPELSACMTIGEMLEESASFILFHEIMGAITGFIFGTVDALLGGKGLGEALVAGLEGAAWGIIFGALISTLMCFGTVYAGCVIALQIFRGAFLVLGGIGTYISAKEGHPAQAIFRGIFALISFRQMGKAIKGVDLIRMNQPENPTCFTGDTLVATEDGHKRIDEIKIGDKVWAYDIYTGQTELKEVLNVYVHEETEILHLHTTDGDINTTSTHPFYVLKRGWVAAGDLKAGDEVCLIDGSTASVTGAELEQLAEPILVYNLEVEGFHTYFVGDKSILVHNQCAPRAWIKRSAFREGMKKIGPKGMQKFINSMKKGFVGKSGSNGIKVTKGMKLPNGRQFDYELKIKGGLGDYRFFGNYDEESGHIIFDYFDTGDH